MQALRLYVLTDEREDDEQLLGIVDEAILGGATAIQLRRKQTLGRRFVELGLALRKRTRERGVLFFINDRVDVAALVDADGVHVGQNDISCRDARRLLGEDKWIGVSAETVMQALEAQAQGADYLGVGAIYATPSKPDAAVTGLDGLAEIARQVDLPIVAIGGLHLGNLTSPLSVGAHGVAVVSEVMSAPQPREAAQALAQRLQAHLSVHTDGGLG
ncbi:thiamine phosphate synthase [Alicyclobacillaceae bacterium I2511]|nr:thiamine phosphate synthase [Alicyclobacillaceae bacterium I2511]